MTLPDLYTVAALALLAGIGLAVNLKAASTPTGAVSFFLLWAAVLGIAATVVAAAFGIDIPGGTE